MHGVSEGGEGVAETSHCQLVTIFCWTNLHISLNKVFIFIDLIFNHNHFIITFIMLWLGFDGLK